MLDTRYDIETPEGIDLVLHPAGPVARILAYLIDLLLRAAIWGVAALLLSWAGAAGGGLFLIVYFLLEWFYPVFFEVYRGGMTPGKKSLGLRVVHDDGTPVGWGSSLVRNLLRAVDFLPFGYVAGVVSMVVGGHFKRLGDLAAGTLVVYAPKPRSSVAMAVAGATPLPLALGVEEQKALLDFAESGGRLSPQRQQELANILTPLTGQQDEAAVAALARYANSLMGRE